MNFREDQKRRQVNVDQLKVDRVLVIREGVKGEKDLSLRDELSDRAGQEYPLVERFIDSLRRQLPVVDRTLRVHGNTCVLDYVKSVLSRVASDSYQSRADFGEVVYHYVQPLLGKEVATNARQDVEDTPVVLTANHHGIDYFAQSVQGSLLFALPALLGNGRLRTIPILACGNIPINNLTYPRGALFYHCSDEPPFEFPHRLPVFPDRLKRTVVAKAPAFTREMIVRAEGRLRADKRIPKTSSETMLRLFRDNYGCSDTLNADSYSDQAVRVNSAIWKQMFADSVSSPHMLCMELEKVSALLLLRDLATKRSLVSILFFSNALVLQLQEELDGAKACWNVADLKSRYESPSLKGPIGRNQGTFLFWGLDKSGRRVPLYLGLNSASNPVLYGKSDNNDSWKIPMTPTAISNALSAGILLPSLYTCFLVTALARGISCTGGYYQAAYLPVMQRGTVRVLSQHSQYSEVEAKVSQVPTDGYLSGMQAVMFAARTSELLPAGPIEIASAGGLTGMDLNQLSKLTVNQAHRASLIETFMDIAPGTLESKNVRHLLTCELSKLLNGSCMPVKRLDAA